MVMPLLGCAPTFLALTILCAQQLACANCYKNSQLSLALFGVFHSPMANLFQKMGFAFFCCIISQIIFFAILTSVILIFRDLSFFALSISETSPFYACFSLSRFGIAFQIVLARLCFPVSCKIQILAHFALTGMSVKSRDIRIKLRNKLDLLASGTSFCFNWFSHDLFLCKRLWLEPVAGTYQWSAHRIISQRRDVSNKK